MSVAEHDNPAALADAPVQQGDVNRIQAVLHNVPMPAFVAQRKPVPQLCQSAAGGATRPVRPIGDGFGSKSGRPPLSANYDTGMTRGCESSWPVKCIVSLALG